MVAHIHCTTLVFLSWGLLDTKPSLASVPVPRLDYYVSTSVNIPNSHVQLLLHRLTLHPGGHMGGLSFQQTGTDSVLSEETSVYPPAPWVPVFPPTADIGRLSVPTPGPLILKGKAILRRSIPPLPRGHSVLDESPCLLSLALQTPREASL